MASTNWSGERAIAGVTSGLIGAGQEVTWRGGHFGFALTHTSRITAYERPKYFQDCMVRGRFRRFCHDHYFELHDSRTLMRDEMEFEAAAAEQFVADLASRNKLEFRCESGDVTACAATKRLSLETAGRKMR